MKSGANSNTGRRRFLKRFGGLLILSTWWSACERAVRSIVTRFTGAPVHLGHRLLRPDFPPVSREERVKILIVGAGIAGLSACRALVKKGETDFLLLEMDQHVGGNAAWSENEYTRYPLGAHYLPLPNRHDTALLEFLREENILTGFDAEGAPVYDETFLSIAPQARLYIRDYWQEGLIPVYGVPEGNLVQIQAFFKQMDAFKQLKGTDERYVFDLPIHHGSTDTAYRNLDRITMAAWLQQEGYTAPELLEHIDYCCLDDFGIGIARVSAWAGIHYFAARKNAQDNVLTWPEGNGFLVQRLEKYAAGRLRRQHLAYEVQVGVSGVAVKVYDAAQERSLLFQADKVILATPQLVNQRLLPGRPLDLSRFHYAPWLVATLVLRQPPAGSSGMPMCWDNVIFQGKGLGYVNTLHQSVAQQHPKCVITYYHAFDGPDLHALRRELYEKDEAYWQRYVLDDLKQAHPDIESLLEQMDIQRWGHGMIGPVPGFIFGPELQAARESYQNRVHFSHSDLSGMSLFEEAFHRGLESIER